MDIIDLCCFLTAPFANLAVLFWALDLSSKIKVDGQPETCNPAKAGFRCAQPVTCNL